MRIQGIWDCPDQDQEVGAKHNNGPGSVSVRFGFLALKPNQTKPFIYNKNQTKPLKNYEAI